VPVDLFTLPPGFEGVDETLEQLRANNSALGEYLERLWDEVEVLHRALAERARGLEHREREVQRKEQELAATLKLAKLYTELSEMRCGPLNQQQDHGKVDSALLAASARIIELEQKVATGDASRSASSPLPIG
jgi:predicted nuclease with TOPRIM domain